MLFGKKDKPQPQPKPTEPAEPPASANLQALGLQGQSQFATEVNPLVPVIDFGFNQQPTQELWPSASPETLSEPTVASNVSVEPNPVRFRDTLDAVNPVPQEPSDAAALWDQFSPTAPPSEGPIEPDFSGSQGVLDTGNPVLHEPSDAAALWDQFSPTVSPVDVELSAFAPEPFTFGETAETQPHPFTFEPPQPAAFSIDIAELTPPVLADEPLQFFDDVPLQPDLEVLPPVADEPSAWEPVAEAPLAEMIEPEPASWIIPEPEPEPLEAEQFGVEGLALEQPFFTPAVEELLPPQAVETPEIEHVSAETEMSQEAEFDPALPEAEAPSVAFDFVLPSVATPQEADNLVGSWVGEGLEPPAETAPLPPVFESEPEPAADPFALTWETQLSPPVSEEVLTQSAIPDLNPAEATQTGSFWDTFAAEQAGQSSGFGPGEQVPISAEASGQFLDTVTRQLYPDDLLLDSASLQATEDAFAEAADFLFPETAHYVPTVEAPELSGILPPPTPPVGLPRQEPASRSFEANPFSGQQAFSTPPAQPAASEPVISEPVAEETTDGEDWQFEDFAPPPVTPESTPWPDPVAEPVEVAVAAASPEPPAFDWHAAPVVDLVPPTVPGPVDPLDISTWNPESLQVLEACPLSAGKALLLVQHEGVMALVGQTGDPANPTILSIKIFSGNPMAQGGAFVALPQERVGNQEMFLAQVGNWQAIISTDDQRIALHTELS